MIRVNTLRTLVNDHRKQMDEAIAMIDEGEDLQTVTTLLQVSLARTTAVVGAFDVQEMLPESDRAS